MRIKPIHIQKVLKLTITSSKLAKVGNMPAKYYKRRVSTRNTKHDKKKPTL